MEHFIYGEEIQIEWEQGLWIEGRGSISIYAVHGADTRGNEYYATGHYSAGVLQEVEDIQLI